MEVNVSVKPMQQDAELQYYDINIWCLDLCILVGVNFIWRNIWCEHTQNHHMKEMVAYLHC
jgi:hypothetical protein